MDKYDLEILTDDWTCYDANSAIVRTSRLAPEEIDRFVAEFESQIDSVWQEMVRAYHEKTNPPGIDLQVEGHFRMKLVYRLLSEDLIEKVGTFPPPESADGSKDGSLEDLCRRIEEVTGVEGTLIRKTLRSFLDSGYIKTDMAGNLLRWYWTHNRHVDRMPITPGSSPEAGSSTFLTPLSEFRRAPFSTPRSPDHQVLDKKTGSESQIVNAVRGLPALNGIRENIMKDEVPAGKEGVIPRRYNR